MVRQWFQQFRSVVASVSDRATTTARALSVLSPQVEDALVGAALDPAEVVRLVRTALAEDLAGGIDVTTVATIPREQMGVARIVPRSAGVVAGIAVAAAVFDLVGEGGIVSSMLASDGDRVEAGQAVLSVSGPVADLLTAERTALNLICRLSGIATLTRAWVDAVSGTGAAIRDTRKTTPGLRALEKYAVRCGGGVNHRMGLWDAALVKDNHVAAAGGVRQAFDAVRRVSPDIALEVEVDTVEQARDVIDAGAELVLLDNMDLATTRECVALARAHGGVALEASGGLTLDRAREVAETGVQYLSVGALTHSAPILDLGMDLVASPVDLPAASLRADREG
jgi:nicotinate-nucleotide pyrophosphorylase (carboxylating)